MEKIELKPCPFCGGTEIDMEDNAYMRCTSCGASSGWKYDPVEAIEAWNNRATENKSEHIDDIMQKLPILACIWRDSETEWGVAVNLGNDNCRVSKGASASDAALRLWLKLRNFDNATLHN